MAVSTAEGNLLKSALQDLKSEVITYTTGKATVKCPFCGKEGVRAFVKPSYRQARTSRISSGARTTYHRVPESITYTGSCPNCGKTAREMQAATRTGVTRRETHEEKLARLQKAGLPMVIEG